MDKQEFWNEFEKWLERNIIANPQEYALTAGETPASYAAATRARMQSTADSKGLDSINLSSQTFKAVFRALQPGVKFSQKALKLFYLALGVKPVKVLVDDLTVSEKLIAATASYDAFQDSIADRPFKSVRKLDLGFLETMDLHRVTIRNSKTGN